MIAKASFHDLVERLIFDRFARRSLIRSVACPDPTAVADGGGTITAVPLQNGALSGQRPRVRWSELVHGNPFLEYVFSNRVIHDLEPIYQGLSENLNRDIQSQMLRRLVSDISDSLKWDLASQDLKLWSVYKSHRDLGAILRELLVASISRQLYIVPHGSDALEHTARYFDENIDELIGDIEIPFFREMGFDNLRAIGITGLEDLGIAIRFTASNTSLVELVEGETSAEKKLRLKENGAESLCSRLRPRDPKNPGGVYINFNGKDIPAQYAVKEPFNGVEMNFADSRSERYSEMMRVRQDRIDAKLESQGLSLETADSQTQVMTYDVNCIRDKEEENHGAFRASVASSKPKAILFKLYHGSTANADPERPDISVVKLISDLKAADPELRCFAVTENDEPVDLGRYSSSVALREAGLEPAKYDEHELALADLIKTYSLATCT